MMRVVLVLGLLCTSCAGRTEPVTIRLGEDACASCRMTIVSLSTAAQIVAPGAEPVLFDEIGCLRQYLATMPLPPEANVLVADHRTGEWVNARSAVFTETRRDTPMSSGILAHASAASRDADPAAHPGVPISIAFGQEGGRR